MPIQFPEPKPPIGICGSCEKRKTFIPNDDGVGDDDFREPNGWLLFTVSRVVANPAYAAAYDEWGAMRAEILAQDLPPEVRAQAEAEEFETDEPRFVRQTMQELLCDECRDLPQTKLGFDEWPDPADDDLEDD